MTGRTLGGLSHLDLARAAGMLACPREVHLSHDNCTRRTAERDRTQAVGPAPANEKIPALRDGRLTRGPRCIYRQLIGARDGCSGTNDRPQDDPLRRAENIDLTLDRRRQRRRSTRRAQREPQSSDDETERVHFNLQREWKAWDDNPQAVAPTFGSVATLDGQGDIAVADLTGMGRLPATNLDNPGDVVGSGLFSGRLMA